MQTYFITSVINLNLPYVVANSPNCVQVLSYTTLFHGYAQWRILILSFHTPSGMTKRSLYFFTHLHSTKYWNVKTVTKYILRYWFYFQWQVATVMVNASPLNLALMAGARVHASVEWMQFVKCWTTKQYVDVCQGTVEDHLQHARVNYYGSSNHWQTVLWADYLFLHIP